MAEEEAKYRGNGRVGKITKNKKNPGHMVIYHIFYDIYI
jgi:hypothetical protein